jgi:beta-glucosidase-like glycosyl hydrolase
MLFGARRTGHLQDVLREQWDFRGWALSDWLTTHATSDIAKGLDQELGVELTLGQPVPDSKHFSSAFKRAIEDDSIPAATLSRSVIRIVGQMERFGLLDGKAAYSEGLDAGYRGYDRTGVAPLFPFGYGLSSTTFAYSALSAVRTARGLDATITVRNTGDRAGRETVQVYLGASPDTHAPQALRRLAGFGKVTLEPGEQRRVTVPVDEEQLRYWDASAGTWRLGTGQRTVYVVPSAAKTFLTASVTVLPR